MNTHWSNEEDAVRLYRDGVDGGDIVMICSLANSLNPNLNHTSYKHQRESYKFYNMIRGDIQNLEADMARRQQAGDYDAVFNTGLWKYHNSMIAESEPFIRSAHENGHARATSFLALCMCNGDYGAIDEHVATSLFEVAANKNHSFSMVHLAHRYIHGIGITQDIGKGLSWYWKASSMGNVDALLDMARMYKNGNHVPKNKRLSLCLFKQAADKNNHWALINLGERYRKHQQFDKAFNYYKTAVDVASIPRHFAACVYLAECYIEGIGVNQDCGHAVRLYVKAINEGFISSLHPRYGHEWDVQHLLVKLIKHRPRTCLRELSPMLISGDMCAKSFLRNYGSTYVKGVIDNLDRSVALHVARTVAERNQRLVEVDPVYPIVNDVIFKLKGDMFKELVSYM